MPPSRVFLRIRGRETIRSGSFPLCLRWRLEATPSPSVSGSYYVGLFAPPPPRPQPSKIAASITIQYLSMERELRLKAFIEEYARVVQLFDDIVSMKESMGRLETYMVVMVCQVGVAMIVSSPVSTYLSSFLN
ncbi:hypothetical protein Q1695_012761 [Nippostrongylus brasiliensis]|nr:hypothetical protein Q1695_012761 [Nippostrongylus brasiliensis]